MSSERLILCGPAQLTSGQQVWREAKQVSLCLWGLEHNINLRISDITDRMVTGLPPIITDLVELATYVYCADQATTRGGTKQLN